jgi:hypothetical protein
MEKEEVTEQLATSISFKRMLNCMNFQIESAYQIHFISKLIYFVIRVIRKASRPFTHSLKL